MQKLKVEKTGCWGTIDGVFQQLPIGHEFIAAGVPPAFAGRVSVVGEVEAQELEVATPGADDNSVEPVEPVEPVDNSAKSKKAK